MSKVRLRYPLSPEPLGGIHCHRTGPAQRHRFVSPVLHPCSEFENTSNQIRDQVGAGCPRVPPESHHGQLRSDAAAPGCSTSSTDRRRWRTFYAKRSPICREGIRTGRTQSAPAYFVIERESANSFRAQSLSIIGSSIEI